MRMTPLVRLFMPAVVLGSLLTGAQALTWPATMTAGTPPALTGIPPVPGPARFFVAHAPLGDVVGFDAAGNEVRRVSTQFGPGDSIVVGDFDGNSIDDFAYGDVQSGDIRVHLREGFVGIIGGLGFDADPGGADALATGDIDGDGTDEIVMINAPTGDAIALRPSGQQVTRIENTSFDSDSDNPDRFAVGDVNGDGRDEMVVAAAPSGDLIAFDINGAEVAKIEGSGFDTAPGSGRDGFAMGDVNGDLVEEFLVADAPSGEVIALAAAGGPPVRTFATGFDSDPGDEDRIAAADIDSDGYGDVVIADDPTEELVAHLGPGGVRVVAGTGFDSDGGAPDGFTVTDIARDVDGDAVRDRVERRGIHDAAGTQLLAPSSPCRETINIEIDYETGPLGLFVPDAAGLDAVADSFARAPRTGPAQCPYPGVSSQDGIELRWWLSEALTATGPLGTAESFDAIKSAHFLPVLEPHVHYSVWGNQVQDPSNNAPIGGRCCYGPAGKDFIAESEGDALEQGTTFMHELGHALGLGHGGADGINEKPNYLSVMNYWFSHTGLRDSSVVDAGGVPVPEYDFSRRELPPLDETLLAETTGVGADRPFITKHRDASGGEQPVRADLPINWDGDANLGETVKLNVNNDDNGYCVLPGANGQLDTTTTVDDDVPIDGVILAGGDFTCDTTAVPDDVQAVAVNSVPQLVGHDDWRVIRFGGWPSGGRQVLDSPEPTEAELDEVAQAWDESLIPDRTVSLAPSRPGFHSAVLGVAVDGDRLFATQHYQTLTTPSTSDRPGSLVVLNRATLQVVARVPVGFAPRSVTVNPVTGRVYVLSGTDPQDPIRNRITVVDRNSLAVLARIDFLTPQPTTDIVVNPRTNRLYASSPSQNRLHVFDAVTNQELTPIQIGAGPGGLAVDQSTNTIFVALSKRGVPVEVAALGSVVDDGVTQVVNPPVSLGPPHTQPTDVALDPGTGRVYVANLGGGTVAPSLTVLDGHTRAIIGAIPLTGPSRAIAINPYGHRVFVASEGTSSTVDTDQVRVIRRSTPGLAFSIAAAPGAERQLYYGDLRAGTITRLSYSSGNP